MSRRIMTNQDILKRFRDLRILVIGDLMLDHYIWGDVHRISPEAPVPVVHAVRDTHSAGGAANVALNLAALGVQTAVIGMFGADSHGAMLKGILDVANIDTSGCHTNETAPTIVKTRVIARNQQLCRIDREAANHTYAMDGLPVIVEQAAQQIAGVDAVIFSDYAKGIITQSLLDQLMAVANEHSTLVAIDPKPARKLMFRGSGLITPNRLEALELAGMEEPGFGETYPLAEAARRIHESYAPEHLIITLGADGMAICHDGKVESVLPTRAREVFDVSGAGDTVIATLTAALAAGVGPEEAAVFANLAAGIVVSKMGTTTVRPEDFSEVPV